jgi:TrmH family RNA methyltransferase
VKLLTLARDLQRRKSRERNDLFVAEGVRTVAELVRSPLTIRGALVTRRLNDTPRGQTLLAALTDRKIAVEEASDDEFATAADTDNPQGVLAIAEVPKRTLGGAKPAGAHRILVLDAVQDPGNVGTLVRTAAALGATATLALPGTVDLWNAKVVRSGMGAHFHHHCLAGTWADLDAFRVEGGRSLSVWAADATGEPLDGRRAPDHLAVVVGNEGSGLSPDSRQRADLVVALPVSPAVESLNVAVAAGIILYTLHP